MSGQTPMRAVVFDIGGILEVTPDPQLLGWAARWDARLGLALGTVAQRLDEASEEVIRTPAAPDAPGAASTYPDDLIFQRMRGLLGLSAPELAECQRDFWDAYLGEPNTPLLDYFAALRPRYRPALLSNSFYGAREREEARYHFAALSDLTIYSHEVGIEKPDPRIYHLLCAQLSVTPSEVVFLDDAPANVAAARALGMAGVLFHDNAQAIAELDAYLTTRDD